MSAYDPKRTFVDLPNLHFFTPELILSPERIGVREFKLVPQVKRGQRATTRVRCSELPQRALVPHFKAEELQVKSLQGRLDLRQRKAMFLDVKKQITAFA